MLIQIVDLGNDALFFKMQFLQFGAKNQWVSWKKAWRLTMQEREREREGRGKKKENQFKIKNSLYQFRFLNAALLVKKKKRDFCNFLFLCVQGEKLLNRVAMGGE